MKIKANLKIEGLGGLVVDSSDHVSKSQLRAWCEANIMPKYLVISQYEAGENRVYKEILEKFCKGEK